MVEALLFTIDGHRYGIWKDQVSSVEAVGAVHRLPFLKSSLAILAVMGDHTSTLADLAPCLGHEPDRGKGEASALVMSEQGQVRGFLVSAQPSTVQVESSSFVALPDYLRIPFVEGFLSMDGEIAPVVAVRRVFEEVLRQGKPPGNQARAINDLPASESPWSTTFRLISAGGNLLAVQAQEVIGKISSACGILRFPLLPPDIDGVTVCDNRVLPVVDMARRVSHRALGQSPVMLEARSGTSAFALLVDDRREEWKQADTSVKVLPYICRTEWSDSAAIHGDQAAAIVDLAMLLSNGEDTADPSAMSALYQAGSNFPELFEQEEVEVFEIIVQGRRFAIPKTEVLDILPLVPLHAVPHSPGIVAAVGAWQGELLPVLDLARVLGASSSPMPHWRMVLLSNGTFRALILSERVPESHLLKRGAQKEIPVHLPYPVVYGCYTEGDAIRLILNIHALALHFDESRAAELLPPLSPAEPVPEEDAEPPVEAAPATVVTPTTGPPVEAVIPAEEKIEEQAVVDAPVLDQPPSQHVQPSHDEERTDTATPGLVEPAAASAPAPTPAQEAEEEERVPKELYVQKQVAADQPAHRGRRMIAAFAASALLIAGAAFGLYESGLARSPTAAHDIAGAAAQQAIAAAQGSAPPAAQQAIAATPAPAAQPPAPVAAPRQAPAPAAALQTPSGPLYVVKEGDTLWDIAQRFTGDPLNYHNLAGWNLIRNPDLIFPGQTIQMGPAEKQ